MSCCLAAAALAGCYPNRLVRGGGARVAPDAIEGFAAAGYARVEREANPRSGPDDEDAFAEDETLHPPQLLGGLRASHGRTQLELALTAPWLAGSVTLRQQVLIAERSMPIDLCIEAGADGFTAFSAGGGYSFSGGLAISRVVGPVEPYLAARYHYGGVDQHYDYDDADDEGDPLTAHRHYRLLVVNAGLVRAPAGGAGPTGWVPTGCEIFAGWAPDPRPDELEHRTIGVALIWR